MRKVIVLMFTAVMAIGAVAASVAGADSSGVASPAAPNCTLATIALTGPYTGPAGPAGLDQRNWGRIFLTNWNAGRAIPGVPRGLRRTRLRATEHDTQLNPQVSATVAVQLRSNQDMLAVNGFSGSQENVAGGPILRRGGLAFVSGSATRASLTDPSTPDGSVLKNGFFRRVVPHDNVQAGTAVGFMRQELNVGSGDTVMVVDQAEAYSVPLSNRTASLLRAANIEVDRQSQAATQTDFTSLANRAVAQRVEVVFFASQVAANAQLFLQQLKSRGYQGQFFGTDGTFDSSSFKVPGAYISSFSLDINEVPAARPFVTQFKARFGDTISFGAPSFVAVQAIAMGISAACADRRVSRAEVRRQIGRVRMSNTILGKPVRFARSGDVVGGVGFSIFQIGNDGSYNIVQRG
ncbi:MAG TPA: branched-chain amino acid ABC transporter substrate-binding protein [Gaiellaceae bacterium]|nr:branched-chain amino acid ABC transporter substrate-binding protein [Gaiellaceae bacterium]